MWKMAFVLWVLLLVLPTAAQDEGSFITLERTSCFGSCPVYKATIYEDGSVSFVGQRKHIYSAIEHVNIGPEGFAHLIQGIEDAGYFDLEDHYSDMDATDNPSVITSVTHNGVTKQVYHYLGDFSVPLELEYVEFWIDLMADVPAWEDSLPPIPVGEDTGWPSAVLYRGSCSAGCPSYLVVVYQDGTVAFLGLANVATIGIRFAYITPDLVKALIDEITQLGYSDLADAYLDKDVSDLPTVTTRVRVLQGYQEVVHDLGDANAPESLISVEEKIGHVLDISPWISGNKNQ